MKKYNYTNLNNDLNNNKYIGTYGGSYSLYRSIAEVRKNKDILKSNILKKMKMCRMANIYKNIYLSSLLTSISNHIANKMKRLLLIKENIVASAVICGT